MRKKQRSVTKDPTSCVCFRLADGVEPKGCPKRWERHNSSNVALVEAVGAPSKGNGDAQQEKSRVEYLFRVLLPFGRSPK